jgi:hypothetical protein
LIIHHHCHLCIIAHSVEVRLIGIGKDRLLREVLFCCSDSSEMPHTTHVRYTPFVFGLPFSIQILFAQKSNRSANRKLAWWRRMYQKVERSAFRADSPHFPPDALF